MAEPKVLAREKLVQGEWYIGDGWCGKIALWDGEFFLAYHYGQRCTPITMGYCTDADGFTPHRLVL